MINLAPGVLSSSLSYFGPLLLNGFRISGSSSSRETGYRARPACFDGLDALSHPPQLVTLCRPALAPSRQSSLIGSLQVRLSVKLSDEELALAVCVVLLGVEVVVEEARMYLILALVALLFPNDDAILNFRVPLGGSQAV